MIIKEFDNGWDQSWGWKKMEKEIVETMISSLRNDDSATVLINSVWYTGDMHLEVMEWLRNNHFDRIVLVAMLDAAIPKPEWYKEFGKEVVALGYYPGSNEIDFFAVALSKLFDLTGCDDLLNPTAIDTAYMCLNRKPHWHRKRLYDQLAANNILDHGLVSMGSEDGNPIRTLSVDCGPDLIAPNSEIQHYGIPNSVVSLGHPDNWKRHFLNIVTETMWDINHNGFVSEKIYKPILGSRPFLLYDPDGGTRWLTQRGFEPYVNDFTDITDLDLANGYNLANFLTVLCEQPRTYWQKKFVDLTPKIMYNKNRFDQYVHEQQTKIAKGLVCQI